MRSRCGCESETHKSAAWRGAVSLHAWRPQQSAVREQGGAGSRRAAGWLILSNQDALVGACAQPRYAYTHAHNIHIYLYAREPTYWSTRGHVLVVRGWGCAQLGWREGLLIKAHQGRSVSTGGRVVQEHRDAPAAVRRSRANWDVAAAAEWAGDAERGKPLPSPADRSALLGASSLPSD